MWLVLRQCRQRIMKKRRTSSLKAFRAHSSRSDGSYCEFIENEVQFWSQTDEISITV